MSGDYTTGEVAKMLGVAPRTVAKWTDSKELKCYRIPKSGDRRIPHDNLVDFMKRHEIPLSKIGVIDRSGAVVVASKEDRLAAAIRDELAGAPVLLQARNDFDVGLMMGGAGPRLFVLDTACCCCKTILSALEEDGKPRLPYLLLVGEDENPVDFPQPAMQKPADPAMIAQWIKETIR